MLTDPSVRTLPADLAQPQSMSDLLAQQVMQTAEKDDRAAQLADVQELMYVPCCCCCCCCVHMRVHMCMCGWCGWCGSA